MTTSIACQLWLTIAAEGKCSVKEIQSHHTSLSRGSIYAGLKWLENGDMITRFAGCPVRYGVLMESVIPKGMRVRQALDALGAK